MSIDPRLTWNVDSELIVCSYIWHKQNHYMYSTPSMPPSARSIIQDLGIFYISDMLPIFLICSPNACWVSAKGPLSVCQVWALSRHLTAIGRNTRWTTLHRDLPSTRWEWWCSINTLKKLKMKKELNSTKALKGNFYRPRSRGDTTFGSVHPCIWVSNLSCLNCCSSAVDHALGRIK